MLKGKKVLLGVTGSIAAYKAAVLVRLLVKDGAEVRVVMTPDAQEFITPLTLSVLSKNHVPSSFVSENDGDWNNHVELALWADLIIVAPATANTISKMVSGACDNLLMGIYLSAKCPVWIAPAMDLDMYKHPATQRNLESLKKDGHVLIPVDSGELASGLEGAGRMAEPLAILELLKQHNFSKTSGKKKTSLAGKLALVSAGPTHEAIDPVRFIGNRSSGKMGFAIAEELAKRGANVQLIAGPTKLVKNHPNIQVNQVVSAEQMYSECLDKAAEQDILVMAAAVSDFTPQKSHAQKIKKNGKVVQLMLEPTKDILKELGSKKKQDQILVGFALETENELENAQTKLKKKNLDMVVLNSLNDHGAGFETDTNKITIIHKHNEFINFELKSKEMVAIDIVDQIETHLNAQK